MPVLKVNKVNKSLKTDILIVSLFKEKHEQNSRLTTIPQVSMTTDFKPDFRLIPTSPGIYLMKNDKGEILYIGKAKNLKNRLRSYFQEKKRLPFKTAVLVGQIASIETLETTTETEALIAESNYVKKYLPRYNILLKDGKHLPFLEVTTDEDFPRLRICRKIRSSKRRYFGPYTSAGEIKAVLQTIFKLFPLRQSKDNLDKAPKRRPCLNHHIGRCPAPCAKLITKEEYNEIVQEVLLFLKGKQKELIARIREKMQEESEKLHFERAAQYRDRIAMVEKHLNQQRVYLTSSETWDAVGIYLKENQAGIAILHFVKGKLVNHREFMQEVLLNTSPEEVLSETIRRFYLEKLNIPPEILVTHAPEDKENLENLLSSQTERSITITVPERGLKRKITELAVKNARSFYEQNVTDEEQLRQSLHALQKLLRLKQLPQRMEAFDVSNLGNTITASHVSFINLKPEKKLYRNYRLKEVNIQNDYASTREVLRRRLKRIRTDNLPLPHLIIVDGGKGHLSTAYTLLQEEFPEEAEKIDITGLSKAGDHTRQITDTLHLVSGEEIAVSDHINTLKPLLQIRDEVHRFAVSYLRGVVRKQNMLSELDRIKGIGEKRKVMLLKAFGSLENIKKQSIGDIQKAAKVSETLAIQILDSL